MHVCCLVEHTGGSATQESIPTHTVQYPPTSFVHLPTNPRDLKPQNILLSTSGIAKIAE